jgi:hypothetical protein
MLKPQTRLYWLELVSSKLRVYDVQVAVRGKYGPVFIGKTWSGRYDKNGEFTAFGPNQTGVVIYALYLLGL